MASMRLQEANRLTFALSVCMFGLVLSGSLTLYLLLATSPRDIGALGVTMWFVGFLLAMTTSLTLIRYRMGASKQDPDLKLVFFRRLLRQDFTWMLFASVALAMQSLHVLNIGDGLLFLLALGIIELYFRTKARL